MSDTKISPNHYAQLTPQPIEVVEAWNLDHHRASALAYIARAGSKPGESFEDDLNKAIWFLQRAITHQAKQPTPEPTSKWTWSVSVDLKAQPVTEEEPRPDSPIKEPVVQTDEVGEGILPQQEEEWNRKLSLQEAAEKELQAWNCWAEFHNRVQRMNKETKEFEVESIKDKHLFEEWLDALHKVQEMQTKTLDDTNGVQQDKKGTPEEELKKAWQEWVRLEQELRQRQLRQQPTDEIKVQEERAWSTWYSLATTYDCRSSQVEIPDEEEKVRYFNRPLFPSYLGSNEYDPEVK